MNTYRMLLALGLGLPLVACNLDVEDPDIVTPGSLTGMEALPTIHAAALGDFILAYSGSGTEGSSGETEGIILLSGLLGDELINTETFPTRIEVDRRSIQLNNGTLSVWFRTMAGARRATEFAVAQYEAFVPAGDLAEERGYPEMIALTGFSYLFFAENFCSGVPFSDVNPDGSFAYGVPLPTAEIFDSAAARFTRAGAAAAALGPGGEDMVWLAAVGLGRTLLDRDDAAGAAAAVAAVPDDFVYLVTHSENSRRQHNGVFNGVNNNKRYGVADLEGNYAPDSCTDETECVGGGPGLPYRSDADPRISVIRSPDDNVGFDSRTPQYDQHRYLDRKASIPLASGLEARLIEAEAAYNQGADADHIPILDALRASPPSYILANGDPMAAMPGLADPGTPAGRVDQLFKERAYWLWLTAHRLSDMRRLIRDYGRPEPQVFPNGAYFKQNLQYDGTDTNFPVPEDEQNNPNFEQCLNRDP